MGFSAKDSWTLALLALSIVAFLAAAHCSERLAAGRAVIIGSVGFSLGFAVLALLSGLAVLR